MNTLWKVTRILLLILLPGVVAFCATDLFQGVERAVLPPAWDAAIIASSIVAAIIIGKTKPSQTDHKPTRTPEHFDPTEGMQ